MTVLALLALFGCRPRYLPVDSSIAALPSEGLTLEFDDPQDLDLLEDVVPDAIESLEVEDGGLVLLPARRAGWYSDAHGPLLAVLAEGDVFVQTTVRVRQREDPDAWPTANFTSAGLLIRSPDGAPGEERWVMFNAGEQDRFAGFEAKTTRPDTGLHVQELAGYRSRSTLYLTPGDVEEVELRLCRRGATIELLHRSDPDSTSTPLANTPETRVRGNGRGSPVDGPTDDTIRFERPDLTGPVQIGLVGNAGMRLQLRATYLDFVAGPLGPDEACADAAPPGNTE